MRKNLVDDLKKGVFGEEKMIFGEKFTVKEGWKLMGRSE